MKAPASAGAFIRRGGQRRPPYVETKEILGGFVIIEAADMDEAVAIASEWPSLSSQPNATVQVQPAFQR